MPAYIINEGIVSGGMFIAIGESIITRAAALGGYISFSLAPCLETTYEQVHVHVHVLDLGEDFCKIKTKSAIKLLVLYPGKLLKIMP